MALSTVTTHPADVVWWQVPAPRPPQERAEEPPLRDAFRSFVGQTLFGQLLRAMRETVGKPAYFHGGRAEEIFQGQLDQVLAERLAEAGGERIAQPMFDLFTMKRQ
ncbi:MAG TPA: hypothetical protein EYH34_01215 [Planctomycetes bacterium]|nr:hypothetical protein [Planctomycetota bacterium]